MPPVADVVRVADEDGGWHRARHHRVFDQTQTHLVRQAVTFAGVHFTVRQNAIFPASNIGFRIRDMHQLLKVAVITVQRLSNIAGEIRQIARRMPVGADEILFSPQRDVSHEAWYEFRVTAAEYRHAIDALPYGKRLPGAVYLIDPDNDPRIPSLLRITVAELRKRMDIGAEFNLLKFHTASPKLSFLAYPDFETPPHPALAEAVIVDLHANP